uniref:Uncharacterized protein n=1 Tax=Klebsiella pneumoniae TaxID=573 RepID=A0A8B0SX63_KLEPN|nr:hypothetical protein [Klebsiella pneumoniae]
MLILTIGLTIHLPPSDQSNKSRHKTYKKITVAVKKSRYY